MPCRGKDPDAEVCDGSDRAKCVDGGLTLETLETCGEHSHCAAADASTSCTCDDGFAREGAEMCKNVNDCPAGACSPGGRCVDGIRDYSCVCDKGYEGTGTKACKNKNDCDPNPCGALTSGCVDGLNSYMCTCMPGYTNTDPHTCSNINECSETNACLNMAYPCRDKEGFYICEGQFLDTPIPDTTTAAATTVNYGGDAMVLLDNVTGLRWQRQLPPVYPKCTGMIATAGDTCTWEQAKAYCEDLVLGGFTEWRLPHKIELESLLDLEQLNTAVPVQLPEIPAMTVPDLWNFWTMSAYGLNAPSDPKNYWYVNFQLGWSYFGAGEFQPQRVRCVLKK